MSDPTLGFQVDTSGLDKGSQSLDKITQSAAKTEQQAGKTSEALNKMGSGSSGNSIAKTAQSVDKMAESLVRASREAQKNLDVTKSLESIVSKTGTSYTQAAASLQSAINAHKSSAAAVTTNTEAVKKSADAHAVLSTQAQSAFHSIRSIAEGALSGASPIQMLTQQINHLSYAASGQGGLAGAFGEVAGRITGLGPVMGSVALGVGGAVAAFLAASVALAKVGDEVERSKSRLTAITGSTKEGAEAFNQIKDAAKSAGVEFSTLESFVEKASQGIDKANTGWPVITVGANKARDAAERDGDDPRQDHAVDRRDCAGRGPSFRRAGLQHCQGRQTNGRHLRENPRCFPAGCPRDCVSVRRYRPQRIPEVSGAAAKIASGS
ncbi:cell wall-associated NlpC family hydrolase [Bradyrhizobium japonicum]